ncbi:ABC transporter ATP-binding protein [Spirochaeta lutea]|uniref:ABC transporter ATP-binding protein n=1 Tax=Spirochaeta lutea TaxID=1480694 RepID=UPI00068E94FA|nr:ABC transporter ATP-binding protein [Spirochaeta lutea]
MNHVLDVLSITKTYPGEVSPAVQGVTLGLQAGEIHAITGESGSGKSTTLRIIAGFENPQAGRVLIQDRLVADAEAGKSLAPEKRNIGMVFQDHALFPHLTIQENIGFGLTRSSGLSKPAIRERIDELLEIVHLRPFRRKYPHEISGGQAQRVALARALAPRPAVLLMDEPFNSLDVRLKQHLIPQVRQAIQATQTPTLLVTHDRNEAFDLADRISIMHQGRILQSGSPQELYERPVSCYVAEFFGRASMLHRRGETYMIRPEHLVFTPLAEETSSVMEIEILGRYYRGHHWELEGLIQRCPEVPEFAGQVVSCYVAGTALPGDQVVSLYFRKSALQRLPL